MSNKFEKYYISIKQNSFTMYLMKITVYELIENTFIELYDHDTGYGYQRKLVPNHYRKIAKFIQEAENPIMPSSIICAIDSANVKFDKDRIIFEDKLRVVDGQHRREGLIYYLEHYKDDKLILSQYELPMIVIIIDNEEDKLIEVETFVNINSKAKPVKTDLAVELREKLRRKNDFEFKSKMDFIESIATSVTKVCNETKWQPWENMIRMAEEQSQKPVGLNTFKNSLNPMINTYLEFMNIDYKKIQRDEKEYDDIVFEIATILIEAWKVVYIKWTMAFEKYKEFNIMKSVGVYAINLVISDCIKNYGINANKEFTLIINSNKETISIWKRGGEFSGLSSDQGFRNIADRILRINIEESPT